MTVTCIDTSRVRYRVTGEGYAPIGSIVPETGGGSGVGEVDLTTALGIGLAASRGDAVLHDGIWQPRGDPTEAAIVVAARKGGVAIPCGGAVAGEVPFSSGRQFTATFRSTDEPSQFVALVKGAPERVLALCATVSVDGIERALDDSVRLDWVARNRGMSDEGLRVIAVAHGRTPAADERALRRLTLVALFGITDPPASGVADAIATFGAAGIRTVMVTGDQAGTASVVARQVGLLQPDLVTSGQDLDRMDDRELEVRVASANIFSRVTPEGKLRLVTALQRRGEIVAMIGDGVNDAAALKRADVGVTMGRRGTDVARETAAVVLQDDRFETIGVAIREGRVVDDNIRKFIFFLFSCNVAEVLVLLVCGISPLGMPLEPIQILWMNLVTDTVPALALAMEPAESNVMARPARRPSDGLLSGDFFVRVATYSALIGLSALGCVAWGAVTGVPRAQATTMNFMALSLAQVFHLGSARRTGAVMTPRSVTANPMALAAVAIVLLLQACTVVIGPVAQLVRVSPLTAPQWSVVLLASVLPAVAGQAAKIASASLGRGGNAT